MNLAFSIPADTEYILCAAIWYKDLPLAKEGLANQNPVNIKQGAVFCGHRHPHCLYTMSAVTGKRSVTTEVGFYTQGFLTSKNRFVDRKEALIIAKKTGQCHTGSIHKTELFSEDIY